MLNVYQFHSDPESLPGYKEEPSTKIIVSALSYTLKTLADKLHDAAQYSAAAVFPPYDTLYKYVDSYDWRVPDYDVIQFTFDDVYCEIIVTTRVVKGYVNDNRVTSVDTMFLSKPEVLAGTDKHLNSFMETLLQHTADALGRK